MGSLYIFTVILYWSFLGGLVRYFIDWFNKNKLQQQLEKQNFQSELALLRNQINPHFLFNTLHNIDALIQKDIKKASDTLIKLSEIMRYMIYDTNTDFVELSKEIEYLRNFISIQMLCHSNQELVLFNTKGYPDDVRIAPMLFIPFIENAFKHATSKDIKHNIRINFEITGKTVKFEMINICDKNEVFVKDKSSGIGLSMVKRRLELLYPGKHELKIENENNKFFVHLIIDSNGN
jgi:two-component system LytT family sensor kinase